MPHCPRAGDRAPDAYDVVTGYYPRLALAPGQRFASKGGYIMHFADSAGPKLVAVSEWTTP